MQVLRSHMWLVAKVLDRETQNISVITGSYRIALWAEEDMGEGGSIHSIPLHVLKCTHTKG